MNGKISNFMEERKATVEEAPYMEMKVSFIFQSVVVVFDCMETKHVYL